jgi:hypothetical protein
MQKPLGTSSGKNIKSCRIFHNESNKIGFAFFRFFYDFLRNLQEPAKALILFQIQLCSQVPGSFGFLTYVPLLCGKTLRKECGFAMGPLGARRRRSGQIPANCRPGPAGRGRGRDPGSLGADSLARTGWGGTGEMGRRRPRAVASVACRAGEVGRRG